MAEAIETQFTMPEKLSEAFEAAFNDWIEDVRVSFDKLTLTLIFLDHEPSLHFYPDAEETGFEIELKKPLYDALVGCRDDLRAMQDDEPEASITHKIDLLDRLIKTIEEWRAEGAPNG